MTAVPDNTSEDGSGFMMCEEAELGGLVGSTAVRSPLVNARLMTVAVAGTNTGVAMFTGRFIVPVVGTVAGIAGVIRTAGTTVFVDVTVGCGAPIPG